VLAVYGHNTVKTELERQKITGTPDMSPSAIQQATQEAGLKKIPSTRWSIRKRSSRSRTVPGTSG
jgi:hypothetical protein